MNIKYAVLATLRVKDAHKENGVRLERTVNVLCTSQQDAKDTYYKKCGRYEVEVLEVKDFRLVETNVELGNVNEDYFFCSTTVCQPSVTAVPEHIMALKIGDEAEYQISDDKGTGASTGKLAVRRVKDSDDDEYDEVRVFVFRMGGKTIGEVEMRTYNSASDVEKIDFAESAYNAEMGHDCIDNFNDAVESLVDSWNGNRTLLDNY